MKKIIVGFIALAVILGGSGVVAASNNAVPGSFLFPVELALEKIQLKLASDDKKEQLRLRFVEERLEEIKEVSEKRSMPSNALIANLSDAVALEIEADVFTNETIVKIEADNKNYGYISAIKTKAELVKEISVKYSLTEEKVNSVIDFQVENRESRADDKGFLNKTHSIKFSEDENEDVGEVLSDIDKFLNQNGDNQNKEELRKSLSDILVLLGDDGKLEIRRDEGEIKIETKNGEIQVKIESNNDNSGKNSKDNDNDNSKYDDSLDNNSDDDSNDSILNDDAEEDDSEVFCRGEWRDPEDCEDNNNGKNDKADDN